MDFKGREEELNLILDRINSNAKELVLIYGRRRVGKSALISESLNRINIPAVYYQVPRTNLEMNGRSFAMAIKTGVPEIETSSNFYNDLDAIFTLSEKKPVVLVIDEFSNLEKITPEITGYLQQKIDCASGKIKIILCGSYIDMMRKLEAYDSPLHGRFTLTLDLKPFDYLDASLFFPNLSSEDKFKFYAVFGGLPFSLSQIHPEETLEKNIKRLFLERDLTLTNEIVQGIFGEIQKINSANVIFNLIISGNTKWTKLQQKSELGSKAVANALKELLNISVLEKRQPINEEDSKKKIFYEIKDNLINFFYSFVYDGLTLIPSIGVDIYYDTYIKERLEAEYFPKIFEAVSKEFLTRANKAKKLDTPFYKIGSYWYDDPANKTNGQFDVATMDKLGYRLFECKYTKNPIDYKVIYEEKRQTFSLPIGPVRLGFISRNGFELDENEKKDLTLFTLDDFYHIDEL